MFTRLNTFILKPASSSKVPISANNSPDGSVQMKLQLSGIWHKLGLTKNLDLPAPEPPITNTLLFRLVCLVSIDI